MPEGAEGRAVDVALPLRLGRLTYRHRGALVPGARVVVPLKEKEKIALLLGEASSPPPDLKEVLSLLDKAPIVPPRLLEFLLWVAEFHLAPEGEVLKYALPASLFRQPKKKKLAPFEGPLLEKPPGSFEATLFFAEDVEERATFLLRKVRETLSGGEGGVLFLVPDRELLNFYRERLKDLSPLVYTGDLTPKKREEAWFAVLKGERRLVLGTRLALFLPFPKLDLLVVEEEEHHGYKQEEGFRGHFRDLALMRAQTEGARLFLSSAGPAVKSFYLAKRGKYHLERANPKNVPFTLVDLRSQKGLLSRKLLNRLRKVLARSKRALLFLNRLGYAPVLMCEECGHLWVCPRCQIPLRLLKAEGKLRCRICPYELKASPLCPSCGGGAPKPLGTGTERLAEILKTFFPEARAGFYGKPGWQEADFIITTARIPRFVEIPGLSLVAVVLADQLFTQSSYLAAERAYQLLKRLSLLSVRYPEAEFLIQTYRPSHHVFKGLRWGYEAFYQEELLFRYQQRYPPFGRLAELILRPAPKILEEVEEFSENFLKEKGLDYAGPLVESPRGNPRLFYLLRASRSGFLQGALRELKEALLARFGGRVRFVADMSPE
ncbi:MAG: primosomal protein N' [Thermodesulfobacteria bacterium]|nr:primosomal protein N' [Thermodesulfobacteriota bacterium]